MSDDFSARYRLLKCVLVDDGIRTHNAQEVATGKVVMVHINDAAGPEEVDAMRAQLASLPTGNKNMVLETATLASGFAVVTEFLPGLTSFGVWLGRDKTATNPAGAESLSSLDANAAPLGLSAEPPPTPGASKPAIRVSFKKPFKAPADVAPTAPTASTAAAPGSSPADFHAASADSFTSLFGAPVDPKSLDSGVEFVRSGPPAAAVNFALHSDVKHKTALPMGEAGMPVPSVLAAGVPVAAVPVIAPPAASTPNARVPSTAAAPAPPPPPKAAPPGEFTMMFAPSAAEVSAQSPAATPVPFPTPLPAAGMAPAVAPVPFPTPVPAAAIAPAPTPLPARAATAEPTPVSPLGAGWARPELAPPTPALVSNLLSGPPPLEPSPLASLPAVVSPVPAAAPPAPPAPLLPVPPSAPSLSQFGWDTPAVVEAPVSKAPPGEFTMLFGAPATAAPLPDQVRNSPMKEAPPPAFSTLTPEKQLESPPVEPLHRVMSSSSPYSAGVNQAGQSPIGNNLASGGYAGGAHYPPSAQPPSGVNYGGAAHSGSQPYQAMPEFAPQPPAPSYPAAHASPMFAQEKPLGGEPSSSPGILPPPIFSSGSSTPLSALGGAAPRISANAGPSEYTQLIANGPAPVVPALKPAKSTTDAAKPGKRRLPTGLVVVINAVLLIATLLIFFVLKQQVPNKARLTPAKPVMPYIPVAPKLPP